MSKETAPAINPRHGLFFMGILATIKNFISPPQPTGTQATPPLTASARARETTNNAFNLSSFSTTLILPPPNADEAWRLGNLDARTFDKASPAELLNLLVDISPEISRALYDFIRMVNPGWDALVFQPNSDDISQPGQDIVDDLFKQLRIFYGSPDVVLNRLVFAGFIRGAFFAELVLGEDNRTAVDLATPDPMSARFRAINDPVRGQVWQLGQFQGSKFVPLDSSTVNYIPIDPPPDSPYGRPLVSPAVFTAIFIIALLHDLRRVVQQQGYPRIDIAVIMDKLYEVMPADLEGDATEVEKWVQSAVADVQRVYASLEPDDAYVHTDVIDIRRPVGTVNASSLGAVDGLIKALERMVTRALKTNGLLMGNAEGSTETMANRQWEIHAAGIKAIQHLLESLLENLLTVALEAQGVQGRVEFRFAELRASEMLRDAQTETMLINNATAKYDAGWISQDEASIEITGNPADLPAPRTAAASAVEIAEGDGDGEERWTKTSGILSKNGKVSES